MAECFYCENGEKLRSLMVEVCELKYAKVFLNRDQKHPGRCIVELKEHREEYFQLPREERDGFFEELALTAQGVWGVFYPNKRNYAT